MTRTAPRLGLAGSAALLLALPAMASNHTEQPVQSWSAMEGIEVATLLDQIDTLPVSDLAVDDQPYCASDAEIAQTLRHDFAEAPVLTAGLGGAELWASDVMGTWTLVAPRADETSCIIASGIGFEEELDANVYYSSAGL
ncbi:MAG: hypothetical protein ACK41U_08850 [Paracoccus sp. (in: a-proteobacteria)]|uniref:hypothetical protein n=1 Tax=Paracoccus sp. TaxID=267 RepID=UPI00391CB3C3